jgi:hypothetical protein
LNLVEKGGEMLLVFPEYVRETLIREHSLETQAKNIESELNGKI